LISFYISFKSSYSLFYLKRIFLNTNNFSIKFLIVFLARKNNLHIKEDRVRGIYVQDATEIYVNDVNQMKRVMKTGADNRTIAATKMNERSSRSHSIFILSLFQKDLENDTTKQSSLFFVDLAGSEKIAKTHVTGQQLEEAKNINKSLSALGNVINSLTSDKKEHVPYRDSKLTRILQESLGGNSKTTLILACSPCAYNDKETLTTLRFGSRAKNIKNTPIINEEKSSKELKNLLEQAERKIRQQDIIIERLENELKKIGQNDIELRIVEELEKGNPISSKEMKEPKEIKELKEILEIKEKIEIKELAEIKVEKNELIQTETKELNTIVQINNNTNFIKETPVKPLNKPNNNTLKLLKQHILITTLSEENKVLKHEKKDLEKALLNRNKEIYDLNDKNNSLEDNYNNLWAKYLKESKNSSIKLEKLFHENQVNCHFLLRLKTNLSRLKADFNFLLLGQTLKLLDSSELDNNKQQIIENIQSTVSLIEAIEEIINEKNVNSLTQIETIEEITQTSKNPFDDDIENSSNGEDNVFSLKNSAQKPIKKSLFVNLTQKTEECEGKLDIYPKAMLTEGDYIEEISRGRIIGIMNEEMGEIKNEETKSLIMSQRKIIESLNKSNQEMNSRVLFDFFCLNFFVCLNF